MLMEKAKFSTIYFPPYELETRCQQVSDSEFWNFYSQCVDRTIQMSETDLQNIVDKKVAWQTKHRENFRSSEYETQSDHNHTTPTIMRFRERGRSNAKLKLKLKFNLKWCQVVPLIILGVLAVFCQVSEECPTTCECKWKSGKESVICANLKTKLTVIPTGLDPGTQLLDLSKNNIQLLQSKVFHSLNLLNLQKIFLSGCNLRTLEKNVFFKLSNLVELDLSSNKIDAVPTHTFDQIPELRELRLSSNTISRIPANAFSGLSRLVRLELSRCLIGVVDAAAFRGLVSLEWLKLDNNRLVTVQIASFYPLRHLKGIDIHGNPWNCSCSLQPFRDWMSKNNFRTIATCSEPLRIAGKSWDLLQREDFACIPKVQSSTYKTVVIEVIEGENATLICRLQSTSDTKVRWMNGKRPVIVSSSRYSLSESFIQNAIEGGGTIPTATTFSGGKQPLGTKVSKLTVIKTMIKDSGTYSCLAESRAGFVSANFTLQIQKLSAERLTGNFLLYGAAIAAVITLSTCLLLLCVVYHCGKQKSRILTEDKIELNHLGQNGRLTQNGHTPPCRNGRTAVPLLHNHNHANNNTNSSTNPQNIPKHCPKYVSELLSSLNFNSKRSNPSCNSVTANTTVTSGLLNKRYKALPTRDLVADEDVQHDSSSDFDENNDNDDRSIGIRMHKKCNAPFEKVSQTENMNVGVRSLEQKFPDVINGEGSLCQEVKRNCQTNGSVRPKDLHPPAAPSVSTTCSVTPPPATYHDHPAGPPNPTITSSHRRTNSESESHSPLFHLRTGVVSTCPPSTSASALTIGSSSNSNLSKTESPYGSSSTYQTVVLSTPPPPPPPPLTFSKFTFTQKPTPPTPRKRTSSFSNTRQNSNPNHIQYYRQPPMSLSQQHYHQQQHAAFPFQRRSMPTSPIHFPHSEGMSHHHRYGNHTHTHSRKLPSQGSDPGLVMSNEGHNNPQEYDYHAAQLASFLEEYRQLQLELMRMSASLTEMDPVTHTTHNINANNNSSSSDPLAVRVPSHSTNNSNMNNASAEQFQQQQIKSILKLKSSGNNNNYLV